MSDKSTDRLVETLLKKEEPGLIFGPILEEVDSIIGERGAGPRNHTYTAARSSPDAGSSAVLRGNRGLLQLTAGSVTLYARLTFASELRFKTPHGELSGWVYNGTLLGARFALFFTDHPLRGDYYLWVPAQGHYTPGDPPPFDVEAHGVLATRTSP